MARNDLPSPGAPNFPQRLREAVMTYLGRTGDPLDRGITLRDLIEGGIARLRDGYTAGQAAATGGALPIAPEVQAEELDLTPPPTPTGFTASAAISHVFIEHDAPLYTQGHGHLRTRVYGKIVAPGDPLPLFADAVEITQFTGTVHAHPSNPSTTWRLWIKWESADGVLSVSPAGGTNGLAVGTSTIRGVDLGPLIVAAGNLAAGAVELSKFGQGLEPLTVVSSVPAAKVTSSIFNTADSKLYRWNGSAYVATVPTSDLAGTVADAQIAGLAASKVTGQLTNAQIADVAAAKLTGQISSAQIADGSISGTKFASGLEPITIVSSVPAAKVTSSVFSTTDGKLYRWNGTAYVATVPTSDLTGTVQDAQIAALAASKVTGQLSDSQLAAISAAKVSGQLTNAQLQDIAASKVTGQLTNAQIADVAAAKVTGQLSNAQIADVSASKLTGQIAETQIANDAISTPKLAAGAITTAKLAAGAVTADTIGANAITAAKIDAGAVTAAKLAAGAVTADAIAANAITSAKIESGAITTAKLAANAVTAGEIAAGAITTPKLAAGAVTANELAAGSVTTAKIAAGSVTAAELAAGSVTTAKLAAAAVTAGEIAAGAVTTAKLAAGAVTANEIAANAITSGKIAAGAVSAAQIAADAVTADKLAANAVTAAKIEAGAVTTAKLAAGAVTADTIAANAITSAKIDTGAITTAKLAAGAVTANEIAAGAVTAGKIAANAVTAAEIAADAITAGKIQAGAVGANQIAANAIAVGTAAIQNGAIVNAMIANLAVDNAKIADLSVAKLTGASMQVGAFIQSTNYTSGASGAGWRINADGTAELQAAFIRGQLTASQIDSRGLSIKDAQGNVILAAGAPLDYANVGGTKPPSNADRTADNTAAGIVGQGAFATLGQITGDNVSTYIANGAIKTAQIGDAQITNAKIGSLDASKITAGFLSAERLQVGTASNNSAIAEETLDKLFLAVGDTTTLVIPTLTYGDLQLSNCLDLSRVLVIFQAYFQSRVSNPNVNWMSNMFGVQYYDGGEWRDLAGFFSWTSYPLSVINLPSINYSSNNRIFDFSVQGSFLANSAFSLGSSQAAARSARIRLARKIYFFNSASPINYLNPNSSGQPDAKDVFARYRLSMTEFRI